MKYLFFYIALIGVIPAVGFLLTMPKFVRLFAFIIPFSSFFFNRSSINFFSYEHYRGTSRGMEIALMHLASLTMLLWLIFSGKRIRLYHGGMFWFIIYFLCGVGSLINADNTLFSFFEIWKMLLLYFVFITVYSYLLETGDYDSFLYGIATLVILNFMVIIYDKYLYGRYQQRGIFPHQNSMAMYMGLCSPIFLARWLELREGLKSLFWAAAFGIGSLSLVWSYSRGAIACFPPACLLVVVISLFRGVNQHKLRILSFMMVCGIVLVSLLIPRIMERFNSASKASGNTRVSLAIAGYNMMKDEFFGVGINNWGIRINYPYTYDETTKDKPNYENMRNAIVETIYVLSGAECGWMGLFSLLAWFFTYACIAIAAIRHYGKSPLGYLPIGAFGGMSEVYMQSVLEWVLKQQINFSELIIIYAMISSLSWQWKHHHRSLKLAPLRETGKSRTPVKVSNRSWQ